MSEPEGSQSNSIAETIEGNVENGFDPLEIPEGIKAPATDYQWFDVRPDGPWRNPERTGWSPVLHSEMPEMPGVEFVEWREMRLFRRPIELTELARKIETEKAENEVRLLDERMKVKGCPALPSRLAVAQVGHRHWFEEIKKLKSGIVRTKLGLFLILHEPKNIRYRKFFRFIDLRPGLASRFRIVSLNNVESEIAFMCMMSYAVWASHKVVLLRQGRISWRPGCKK